MSSRTRVFRVARRPVAGQARGADTTHAGHERDAGRIERSEQSAPTGQAAMTDVQLAPPATRHVAAGGWRRAAVGLLVGALAGSLALRVVPRDAWYRRRQD